MSLKSIVRGMQSIPHLLLFSTLQSMCMSRPVLSPPLSVHRGKLHHLNAGSSSAFDNASHGKGASGHLGASSGSSLADAWCPSYQSSSLAWLCMRLSSARTSAAAASASAAREPKAEAPARPPDAPAPDGGRGCCGVLDGGAGCGFGDPPRFFAPPPPRGSAARAAPLLGLP